MHAKHTRFSQQDKDLSPKQSAIQDNHHSSKLACYALKFEKVVPSTPELQPQMARDSLQIPVAESMQVCCEGYCSVFTTWKEKL